MSSAPPAAPICDPDVRKQKRHARWFIAALVLVPLAALAVFIWSITLDEPPPDISDLVTPPPHYNPSATHCFNNAIIAMEPLYPRELHRKKYLNEVGEMEWGEKWHPHVADELFTAAGKNNLWAAFDSALKAPDELNDWSGEPPKEVLYFINLAQFIKLHAFHQSRLGDHGGAIHSAIQLIEFGNKIENNIYSFYHLFVGSGAKAIGVDTLGEVLKACDSITALDARSWCERLSRQSDSGEIIPLVKRAEVVSYMNLMSPSPYAYFTLIAAPNSRLLERIYFKPNQTLRLIAENTRARMAGIGPYFLSYKELTTRLAPELERQCRQHSPFDIVNKDGRAAVQMVFESDLSMARRHYITKSIVSAAQAALAARAYEHDHGKLPDTLDVLVPRYLSTVPIDYMDGRPIRYSKAERAVWTIGPNNLAEPLPPAPATRNDHTDDEEHIFRLDHRPRPPDEPPPATASQSNAPAP